MSNSKAMAIKYGYGIEFITYAAKMDVETDHVNGLIDKCNDMEESKQDDFWENEVSALQSKLEDDTKLFVKMMAEDLASNKFSLLTL